MKARKQQSSRLEYWRKPLKDIIIINVDSLLNIIVNILLKDLIH